jgi:hypothetical protein
MEDDGIRTEETPRVESITKAISQGDKQFAEMSCPIKTKNDINFGGGGDVADKHGRTGWETGHKSGKQETGGIRVIESAEKSARDLGTDGSLVAQRGSSKPVDCDSRHGEVILEAWDDLREWARLKYRGD